MKCLFYQCSQITRFESQLDSKCSLKVGPVEKIVQMSKKNDIKNMEILSKFVASQEKIVKMKS